MFIYYKFDTNSFILVVKVALYLIESLESVSGTNQYMYYAVRIKSLAQRNNR